jgi:lipopolysaccharide export system permease protein
MRIIRIYLIRELLKPIGMSLILFTFILLVGNLVKLADLLVNKGVSVLHIAHLFALLVPTLLSHTVPMAVLTGTLLAFGRLSSDREILAMRASGISLLALSLPLLTVGTIVSLGLVPINDRVVPLSHYETRKLLVDIGIKNPTAFLEAGTFIKEFKPYILFVYQVNGNRLSKVRIYEPQEGRPTRTVVAESGEFIPIPSERRVVLKLTNGSADEPDPRDPSKLYKLKFATYAMNLSVEMRDPQDLVRKPKDMTLDQIRLEVASLKAQGVDPSPLKAEAYRRIAMAFSPLVFILIGFPLAITTRRAQRSVGLAMSVVVFVGYYGLLILGQGLAQKGILTAGPAVWLGNIVLGLLGAGLLWRASRA